MFVLLVTMKAFVSAATFHVTI